VYGIDLGDPSILHGRSWPWLRARIYGLIATDCPVSRAVRAAVPEPPTTEPTEGPTDTD
jgi:hypothetical protein